MRIARKKDGNSSEIARLIRKMIPVMLVMNVVAFLVTLFWGFDIRNLVGFAVGFVYMVWCYSYLGRTVERAVEQTVKKAKGMMYACYGVRFAGLFLLCFLGFEFKLYSVVGIILPQLYPRILLSADALSGKNYFGKD